MELEQVEAGSYLLMRAIIQDPAEAAKALELRPSFLRPGVSLHTLSPWNSEELWNVGQLFPGVGISYAMELGLFGTAVGLDPRGELGVRVYTNRRGKSYFHNQVLRDPRFQRKQELPVWVVGVDSIKFASAKQRPCIGGVSIGPEHSSTTGTLGAWLKKNPSGEFVGVSNNHVLAEFGRFGPGDGVIQPGQLDGGGSGDTIGEIEGVVNLKEHDPFRVSDTINLADVAWFKPINSPSSLVDPSIGTPNRHPKGEEDLITEYRSRPGNISLWLAGRSSSVVSGAMTAIRASFFMQYAGKKYFFEDQIELTMSNLQDGDSGSLVLTDVDKIGGLFFALDDGPSGIGFANPWQAVKSATGLSFSYT